MDSNIIVAVIDSGVDYTHPDLKANMWINPGEDHPPLGVVGPEDFDGINDDGNYDSNGNPLIDDIYGYDFCNNDGDPMDDLYHGTHCAGIIGAVGNNNVGITGVCWNVKIMALKFLDFSNQGDIADVIKCIDYAVDKGAKVLSNSWCGFPYSAGLEDTIEAAGANGVLFITIAGNGDMFGNPINIDETYTYPASYDCDNIISVLATNDNDEKAHWSNYGAISVDLGAPGVDIFSTFPTYPTSEMAYYGCSTYYETISGTSMAAPYVAGACALLWSAKPQLSHLQVKDCILASVDKLDILDGNCVSEGRLNIRNALNYKPPLLILTKSDDVNDNDTVEPNDYITYTITYDPNGHADSNDKITDYLSQDVDFNSASGSGEYSSQYHTVTWQIGDINANDSNSVTLSVKVNECAEPNSVIINYCEIEGDNFLTSATAGTNVGQWYPNSDIIYVDDTSLCYPGTGMSWRSAYVDLQDALERADDGRGNQIWVAKGTYYTHTKPGPSYYWISFELVDGVDVYGGFAGYETSLNQRNWIDNQTILEGDIDNDDESDTNWLVKAAYLSQETILDGFIIRNGFVSAVQCNSSSMDITNCIIKENGYGVSCYDNSSVKITKSSILNTQINEAYGYGIISGYSDIVVSECNIADNASDGIHCGSSDLTISNSIIHRNGGNGIYDESPSSSLIKNNIIRRNGDHGIHIYYVGQNIDVAINNNWIHNNGTDNDADGDGIYVYYIYEPGVGIRNNTIVDNKYYGIEVGDVLDTATVTNCILWGNDTSQLNEYCSAVTYSDIQNWTGGGTGNIKSDPCFVYPSDPNDYHIKHISLCVDKGLNFSGCGDEYDIDGEDRLFDGDDNGTKRVDIGADEYYWSSADIDGNGIVNFFDYAVLGNAWRSESGDDNYNVYCDLKNDNVIDYKDLALFSKDWLWQPAWEQSFSFGCGFCIGEGLVIDEQSATQTAGESVQSEQVQAEQAEPIELTPLDIEQMAEQLEDIWQQDDGLSELITESQWQAFLDSLNAD